MEAYTRRKRILALLGETGEVRIDDLVQRFGVSANSIRADLTTMEQARLAQRIRGGAVAVQEPSGGGAPEALIPASIPNRYQKEQIGCWAAGLVKDGEAIIMDASSTVLHMASCLSKRRNLTVVTNGLRVAQLLAKEPTNKIILAAPVLRADGNALVGSIHPDLLTSLRAAKCFFSCSGISPEEGLTEVDVDEAALKAQMLKLARQVIVLVDHSKFEKTSAFRFAELGQVNHLVTDEAVSPEQLTAIRGGGSFPVTVVGPLSAETLNPPPAALNQRRFRIGFANLSERVDFCRRVRTGLESAARHCPSVELLVLDNDLDQQKTLDNVGIFVDQRVDLAIEFQIDYEASGIVMERLKRAGMPVIAVDIPLPGATFFGADNYRAGYIAGEALGHWINEHWGGQPDVVLRLESLRTGPLPSTRLHGQMDGLRSVLGSISPERVIVLDVPLFIDEVIPVVANYVASIPETSRVAVVAIRDEAALGALAAFENSGRLQNVVAVGQNVDCHAIAALRRPDYPLLGSTGYFPEEYGERLVATALRILRGEAVPPAVFTRHVFIDRKNLDQYYPEAREREE